MINNSLSPQLHATATPASLPASSPPHVSRPGGAPEAAGTNLAGGAMILRLTHALTGAVSSPAGTHISTEAVRINLLVHLIDLHLAQGQLDQADALLATATAADKTPALNAAYLLSRQAEVNYLTSFVC
jgi:hypothetical protein